MKRMLFNATHQEELRVAIVDGQKLLDLDLETVTHHQKKGNIYKGVVTRVEPSLEAAFVDYGAERQGFLPLKEISRSYFQNYSASTPMAQVRIQDVIKEGQELVLQVEKDERGNKGAALTSFISLAGRFLVLMPNNPKGGGISRRIEGEDRVELREYLNRLEVPSEHALIARTAGIGRSFEEIQWDLDYLLNVWKAINDASGDKKGPFLIYQESNLVVRAIRDYLRTDITEILIDDQAIFDRARKFMEQVMPQNLSKLKLYDDNIPLFSRFQIEHQIEAAFSRQVRLSSGGALVIDHTEAVVTIDVNSAKATKGADIEETALQTNLEAADEIARQLRIRDLGGLLVIDMIDMTSSRNQRAVETRLIDALKADRARVQVGRISRFGLLEMSRQRLRSSLGESNYLPCPRCSGNGTVRSTTSSALSILRILEEEAQKENTEAIHANLPFETATYLLNEKRHEIGAIEKRLGTTIFVIPTATLDTPHFQIKRLRAEELTGSATAHSFEIENDEKETMEPNDFRPEAARENPVIDQQDIATAAPPPLTSATTRQAAKPGANGSLSENRGGFFRRVFGGMFSTNQEQPTDNPEDATTESRAASSDNRRSRSRGGGDSRQRRQSQSRRSGGQNNSQSSGQDSRRGRGNNNSSRSSKSADGESNNRSSRSRRGQGNRRNNQSSRDQSNRNSDSQNGSQNNSEDASKNHDSNAQSNASVNDNRDTEGDRKQRSRRRGRGRGRQSSSNSQGNRTDNRSSDAIANNSNAEASTDRDRNRNNRSDNDNNRSSRSDSQRQRRSRGRDNRRDGSVGEPRNDRNQKTPADLPDDIGNRRPVSEISANRRASGGSRSRSDSPDDTGDRTTQSRSPSSQNGPDRSNTTNDSRQSAESATPSHNQHERQSSVANDSGSAPTGESDRGSGSSRVKPADVTSKPEADRSAERPAASKPDSTPAPVKPTPSEPAAPAVTASPSDYLSPKKTDSSGNGNLVQVETGNNDNSSDSSA